VAGSGRLERQRSGECQGVGTAAARDEHEVARLDPGEGTADREAHRRDRRIRSHASIVAAHARHRAHLATIARAPCPAGSRVTIVVADYDEAIAFYVDALVELSGP
jgi:hypothetical protein